MGKFIQDGTGVVVSVADHKDYRFEQGFKPYDGSAPSEDEVDPDGPEAEAERIADEKKSSK